MFVGTWPVEKIKLSSRFDNDMAMAAIVLQSDRPVVLETRIHKDDWEFAQRHGIVQCIADKELTIEDLMTQDGD